jgi:hypothetical protein
VIGPACFGRFGFLSNTNIPNKDLLAVGSAVALFVTAFSNENAHEEHLLAVGQAPMLIGPQCFAVTNVCPMKMHVTKICWRLIFRPRRQVAPHWPIFEVQLQVQFFVYLEYSVCLRGTIVLVEYRRYSEY